MKARFVLMLIIIIVVILFVIGAFLNEQCIIISGDKACWKTTTIMINSTFCPNASEPCLAKPEIQQYNAIVDLLLRSCDKAEQQNYADTSLNRRIEEVVQLFMGMDVSVSQLCEQPGMVLTHRLYE